MSSPTALRPRFADFVACREKICVVGLGYVGLPLAAAFARQFLVLGFDISETRIGELRAGRDRTRELTTEQLRAVRDRLQFSSDPKVLGEARLIIVTVPTPIDDHKNPDLTLLAKASEMIGRHIMPGTTVVYESTVYPGCTEEDCVPLIERGSGLKWKQDFFAGYSPERINPGDHEHTVDRIKKVISGDAPETVELLRETYGAVTTGGVFLAASIKTAEAAKVIENTQRDLNIALMNELAIVFDRMGIRTDEVIQAAATKWNFAPFRPGLVGGHCIGVDPYYLTYKAELLGYHPQIILAGRRINEEMGRFIAGKTVKLLILNGRQVKGGHVLVMGWCFKENVPDVRNTKVADLIEELSTFGVISYSFDPLADKQQVKNDYGIDLCDTIPGIEFDAIVLAVKHDAITQRFGLKELRALGGPRAPIIIDVKGFFTRAELEQSDMPYWSL